ncbi:hypothetical protein JCM16303_005995 [Sporobolomyces ruberrimus]
MTARTDSTARPSHEEIINRWDTLLKDPLLSFESLKRKAAEGHLEASLRSFCWRYFFGLLPSPSSLAASPSTNSIFSTYSLLLSRQRSEYGDLREKYLRAPDGGWIKDGETKEEDSAPGAGSREGSNDSGLGNGKRPVKIDVKVNNPLGLEEDNPWQSWFADLDLRKTIRQDVQRTFPEVEYFRQASTQNRMTDLLFIYTKLTPDTGYRQGMHELLAPILWSVDLDSLPKSTDEDSLPHLVLSNDFVEHDAYQLFSTLMKSAAPFYDHKATIPLSKPPQQSRAPTGLGLSAAASSSSSPPTLVQPIVAIATHLHSLLATLDPPLHAAFTRLQIEPQLYAIRWLRLLFSREFPLSETLTLWDGIFARDPSIQITQHVAAAMLLRIRDSLITAERVGGYGEFLQVLLRYPACPDGTFRTPLLLSQAVYLRDNLSHEGAEFVRRQNEELGIVQPHDEHDEETDLRSAAARGARGQRRVVNGGSPSVGAGLLGEGGLVGDLAKGVYGRAEALGINKAILGTFNDIRRGVTAAQAQIEEQRQRQRGQFSQIPSRAPWEAEAVPSSATRDALADLARMRASGTAMAEALDLCVTVLERALSPPTSNSVNGQSGADHKTANGAGSTDRRPSSQSTLPLSPALGSQVMAITTLKHVRDVLGGQAKGFDSSVLLPLQQTLDLLNKSPPLPPLPFDSPALRENSPTPSPPMSPAKDSASKGESIPLSASAPVSKPAARTVPPPSPSPIPQSQSASPPLPPAPSSRTNYAMSGSRAQRTLLASASPALRQFTTNSARQLQNPDLAKETARSPPPSSQLSSTPFPAGTTSTINVAPKISPAPAPVGAASTPSSSSSSSSSLPPPPPPKAPKHRLRTFGRSVLFIVAATGTFVVWRSYEQRHPGEQLPHDPSLPTVVVLGNGWGSSAFLKELDNSGYNVVVISPRNYFLFTPLLPSVTVGTLGARSILEPTRFLTRHMKRKTEVYEGEVYEVDPENKTVRFLDNSEIKGEVAGTEIPYDYLVYAVGAENQTFGIKGVKEHACFLKEVWDAEKIRGRIMDCIETANFAGQTQAEIDRLLHFVVVGGGPTGVEYAGELHDFLKEDLGDWYPELASRIKITLIEALPNVLPMFSKQLIDYTMSAFKENKIDIATKTMVKEVKEKSLVAQNEKKELVEYPYGLLVWATGNTARQVTKDLMNKIPTEQNSRRGLLVDEHLRLLGADGIFALGDCTATNYAPTAQVAAQQGRYLARVFSKLHKKDALLRDLDSAKSGNAEPAQLDSLANAVIRASNISPFSYSHQGSLAYIGSDKAIADLPFLQGNLSAAGLATYYFWRSAYISQLFSLRNRLLVLGDWVNAKVLGRDVSRA